MTVGQAHPQEMSGGQSKPDTSMQTHIGLCDAEAALPLCPRCRNRSWPVIVLTRQVDKDIYGSDRVCAMCARKVTAGPWVTRQGLRAPLPSVTLSDLYGEYEDHGIDPRDGVASTSGRD